MSAMALTFDRVCGKIKVKQSKRDLDYFFQRRMIANAYRIINQNIWDTLKPTGDEQPLQFQRAMDLKR
jgi:hypothetical protein